MTLLRLAVVSHRGGLAATTVIAVLFAVLNGAGYFQIAGSDPAQRAVFAQQMSIVGRQLSYVLPLPVELDALSGYMQWRVFGTVGLIYGFWSVIAASGAGRGDEERGLVETWLASGTTRLRYVVTRVIAFLGAAVASIAGMMAATWIVAAIYQEPIPAGALALQGVALTALTAFCFAFSLLVAQLTTTRSGAAGAAGIALLALFLVDSATRTGGLEEIRWLSPFWAYDQTHALLRGGGLDVSATAALAGASIVVLVVATWGFASRDLGAALVRPAPLRAHRTTMPSGDPLLRMPVIAILDQEKGWVISWAAGVALLGTFLISLTRTIVDSMLEIPAMRVYLERLGTTGYDAFVAVIWGSTAMLLLALFAIFQTNGWVADDAEGRLETVLGQPVSRARVAVERISSLALAAALITLAGAIAVWVMTRRVGIDLTADRYVVGSALLVLVPIAFGAVGAAIAGWRPRVAVPVLFIVALASYLTLSFAPLFGWPQWVLRTSIFALYGEPLARPVDGAGIAILLGICVVGTAFAVALFQRRDIAR